MMLKYHRKYSIALEDSIVLFDSRPRCDRTLNSVIMIKVKLCVNDLTY
jgi:hypothetical protein